jgi:hypothetical protein
MSPWPMTCSEAWPLRCRLARVEPPSSTAKRARLAVEGDDPGEGGGGVAVGAAGEQQAGRAGAQVGDEFLGHVRGDVADHGFPFSRLLEFAGASAPSRRE